MLHKPKIVVIGGGTGLPVVLRGLRDQNVDVTAVVTVADDGGSSGILRNYINVVPPGDIRNGLVALSELPDLELDIFQYRFKTSDQFFAGHAIGNLIIAALSEMESGIFDAVQRLSEMMAVDGHIGIHDATWRKEFGGEIYKTNGSHGCINTPLEIMTELYDLVEIGTPVIMFY